MRIQNRIFFNGPCFSGKTYLSEVKQIRKINSKVMLDHFSSIKISSCTSKKQQYQKQKVSRIKKIIFFDDFDVSSSQKDNKSPYITTGRQKT